MVTNQAPQMKYWRNIIAPSRARVGMSLRECPPAERQAPGHFDQRVARILELDVRRNVPLLPAEQLKHLRNWRVAFTPRHVRRAPGRSTAILQVQVGDACVLLLKIR